jgi:MFS family permease
MLIGLKNGRQVIVPGLVPLRDTGKYISTILATWAVADVAGPLLGGSFAEYVTWRWCFWINLCIGPISELRKVPTTRRSNLLSI